jgi:dolichol-phosphate mannosyltransferase
MPQTTVVMPTYNEAENLPLMLDALLALPVDLHVLVVDDNSPDGTGAIADRFATEHPAQIAVLHRKEKGGLGPAYLAGFKRAIEMGADYLIQMDADFSHQPKYIPEMIAKIDEGNYDTVIGSRWTRGGGVDESWSVGRKLLSWFANGVYVRTLLGLPVKDATGGFRLWKRETLKGMGLERVRSNGYVFQVEITYIAYRLGYKFAEIPIYFPDRERGQSKMGSRIIIEAALRVWQVLLRHHSLNPQMRLAENP